MKPSSLYQLRIDSIESSTDWWTEAGAHPLRRRGADVEPIGELKEKYRCSSIQVELSASKTSASLLGKKYRNRGPPCQVFTTRSMDRAAVISRCGVPRAPQLLGRDDGISAAHAPEAGELDAALLEDRLPRLPVGLDDIAALPLDLVVGGARLQC